MKKLLLFILIMFIIFVSLGLYRAEKAKGPIKVQVQSHASEELLNTENADFSINYGTLPPKTMGEIRFVVYKYTKKGKETFVLHQTSTEALKNRTCDMKFLLINDLKYPKEGFLLAAEMNGMKKSMFFQEANHNGFGIMSTSFESRTHRWDEPFILKIISENNQNPLFPETHHFYGLELNQGKEILSNIESSTFKVDGEIYVLALEFKLHEAR